MDVRLSDEQQLIRETAARLGAQHAIGGATDLPAAPDAVARVWRALAEADLLGLGAAPDEEGSTAVATALIAEQLARHLCPAPYIGQGVLAPALLTAAGAHVERTAVSAGLLRYCPLLRPALFGFAPPDD